MVNAWSKHLKEFRRSNAHMSLGDSMKAASKSYKQGGFKASDAMSSLAKSATLLKGGGDVVPHQESNLASNATPVGGSSASSASRSAKSASRRGMSKAKSRASSKSSSGSSGGSSASKRGMSKAKSRRAKSSKSSTRRR
jgi:hypothetical protein